MLVVKYPIAEFSGNISNDFAIFHKLRCLERKPNYINCNESIERRDPLINISDLFWRLTRLESKLCTLAGSRSID